MTTHSPLSRPGAVMLLVLLLGLGACSADPVESVKTGTLSLDESVTVGNALDRYRYFTSYAWKSFSDAQKRTVVQFTGVVDVDAYKDKSLGRISLSAENVENAKTTFTRMEYVAQFAINLDGENFSIAYSGYLLYGLDNKMELEVKDDDLKSLRVIYHNELDGEVSDTLVSKAIAYTQKQHEHALQVLEASIGKFSEDFLDAEPFASRLRAMLKDRYNAFAEGLSVSSGMEKKSGWYVLSGCVPHACGVRESFLCINGQSLKIFAAILEDEKISAIGDDNDYSWDNPLRAWAKERGVTFK